MTACSSWFLALTAAAVLTAGSTGSLLAQQPATRIQQQNEAAEKRSAEVGNIRVEILLTDTDNKKTISEQRLTFLLAHDQLGRLRRHLPGRMPFANRNFEVDLTPAVVGNRVRIALTVKYTAAGGPGSKEGDDVAVEFVETTTTFVESGKPTVVIEATGDPADRRVTVQATATILR